MDYVLRLLFLQPMHVSLDRYKKLVATMNRGRFVYNLLSCMVLLLNRANSSIDYYEICASPENKKIYIEPGKKGIIATKTSSVIYNREKDMLDFYQQCRLELVSCPACVVFVKFIFMNLTQNCVNNANLNACGCDYVWIHEPSYEEASGKQFCGYYVGNDSIEPLFYRSQTRSLIVMLFKKHLHQHTFTLQYEAERNQHFIQGYFGNDTETLQTIATPFFAQPYLKDLHIEFIISCRIPLNCRVHLIFTDFLIAKISVIKFIDSKGQRLHIVTGLSFRPPVIISSGPSLIVRFYANGAINQGFKAVVTFLPADASDYFFTKPNMECGGLIDNLGGTLSLTHTVKNAMQMFDCVWIVQLSRKFLHSYTHSYLKVVAFSGFAGNSELSIHQGLTSDGATEEILRYPYPHLVYPAQKEHILPILQGAYISFKGVLHVESNLAIAYTAFSYNDCIPGTDFSCKNHNCIPVYLQCDGYDHCGDNSDEFPSCSATKGKKGPRRSELDFLSRTNPDLYVAMIMFIICFFALTLLIFALIFFITRTNRHRRYPSEMHNSFQVINDVLEQDTSSIQEEIIADEPPVYEAPPSYSEISRTVSTTPSNQKRSRKRLSKELRMKCRSLKKRESCRFCSQQGNVAEPQYAKMRLEQDRNSLNSYNTARNQEMPCSSTDLPQPSNSNDLNVLTNLRQAEIQSANVEASVHHVGLKTATD